MAKKGEKGDSVTMNVTKLCADQYGCDAEKSRTESLKAAEDALSDESAYAGY